MTQTWDLPGGNSDAKQVREQLSSAALSLQSGFRGSSQPSAIVAGQSWNSDVDNLRRFHDGAVDHVQEERFIAAFQGAASASQTAYVYVPWNAIVTAAVVVSDTATTSDGSNHWGIEIYDRTADVSLYSAVPNTNGQELAAHTPWSEAPDLADNDDIAAGSVLEVRLIATGAPTSLGRVLIGLNLQRVWS